MNRADFQELAQLRLKEAKLLLDADAYDGAYYLAGYAVECGLKACIAKRTKQHDFPDKKTVNDSYTHALLTLLSVSGLSKEHEDEKTRSNDSEPNNFRNNWATVKDWSEETRYKRMSKKQAEDLYKAIADPKQGVFSWLQKYW